MHVQTFKCRGSQTWTDLLPSIGALRRKCWCTQRLLETADSNSQRPRNWVTSTYLDPWTLHLAEQGGNETSFRLLEHTRTRASKLNRTEWGLRRYCHLVSENRKFEFYRNILQTVANIIQSVYFINVALVTCQISAAIVKSVNTVF